MKTILYRFVEFCLLGVLLIAQFTAANASTEGVSHLGPTIAATIQRGKANLPIFLVDHLRKGDKLLVTTDKHSKGEIKWLLVLATVSPISNIVQAEKFDLAEYVSEASIDITSDDQVPIIVLAPQVRTMFGLFTSFSESAALIVAAIKADPQRFVDLQRIDQINHAIALLSAALDAIVQSKKPEQAVAAAKALAAKFGVMYVDPGCFKGDSINSKCVAANIVSSKDLTVPSEDIWSAAGPNSSAAKMPTDLFASLKIVTEASTYLVNKYGDNYDFAPASGQRQDNANNIRLYTNARFKSGEVKTAYVYVPSWFSGRQPELVVGSKVPTCLTRGELVASVQGSLPLTNYWHDWSLTLHESGSTAVVAQFNDLEFKPDNGLFAFDFKKSGADLSMDGRVLDATLTGKFGFADVSVAPFKVSLPDNDHLFDYMRGLQSVVSGEHARLRLAGADGNACVEQMEMRTNDKTIAASSADLRNELNADLSKTDPGPATLEIRQFGVARQELPIVIKKRRTHIQRLVHFDLETDITAYGDNLDRIESIQAGRVACRAIDDSGAPATPATRVFSCPGEISANANFPAQVTVKHRDQEPAPFEFPVTKIAARPHMTVDGASAAIVTNLSTKAIQWGLSGDDVLVTENSGLGILIHAFGGYRLSRGPYVLQLKFSDDPQTEQTPISVPLMSDLEHNELRTRSPISFVNVQLPSIVNPIWYRVQHQPSGLIGDWQPLNRSIAYLPELDSPSCGTAGSGLLIHGNQLELIDWASNDLTRISATQPDTSTVASLTRCEKGMCLGIKELGAGKKLKIKVHWIDNWLFDVTFPDAPNCGATK